jgi:glutamate synthase (NADPH) large chain
VLGPTGRNFAAGMSGGIAYVYDPQHTFADRVNYEMVELESLEVEDRDWLLETVVRHRGLTDSTLADRLLADWEYEIPRFRKVMPRDYRRVLDVMRAAQDGGFSVEEAHVRVMAAAHG